LKQTAHHFISFTFFSDGDAFSVKCLADSLSGAGLFNSLPGQGVLKTSDVLQIILLLAEVCKQDGLNFLFWLPLYSTHALYQNFISL
jgi:hypothetical protein